MRVYTYPTKQDWREILERPLPDFSSLEKKVKKILQKVKEKGDRALIKYTAKFDDIEVQHLQVSEAEIMESIELVPPDLKAAIQQAAANIETFHRFQLERAEWVVTMPGIMCSRISVRNSRRRPFVTVVRPTMSAIA